MSNWTHVAAVARIDSVLEPPIDFTEIFGKECFYDDVQSRWNDMYEHKEKYLPYGSEGTLSMSVWENPHENHAAKYTVSIFGDLRDHYSADEIIRWFKNKLDGLFVRQAVITVENEYYGTKIWTYNEDDAHEINGRDY